jgi:lysosomal acid lipase/cholesteryl ester hydrolase
MGMLILKLKINTTKKMKVTIIINYYFLVKNYPSYAEKIISSGFDFEEHKILTEDGYILTAWRIPGKINENDQSRSKRKPILLQHGIMDSSYTWLILDPKNCLSIMLAEQGYDVWMANSRGNIFSTEHINSTEFDSHLINSKFWDFSFHEMAIYDFPANVNYIKNMTNREKIIYLGHSQGTIQYFISYTLNPKFIEENIEKFITVGPVLNVFSTTSKIVQIAHYTSFTYALQRLGIKNIFVMQNFMYEIVKHGCRNLQFLCRGIVKFFIEDYDKPSSRINYQELFNLFMYLPGGTSIMNINHWIQMYGTGKFGNFDFGRNGNMEKYGQELPPEYNMSEFKNYQIKSLVILSDSDPFSKEKDLSHILDHHKNTEFISIKRLQKYNHLDYLWSDHAKEDIYNDILEFLER